MKEFRAKLECECGCSTLNVEYLDHDDYYVGVSLNGFGVKSLGVFGTIRKRLELIWYILRGKDYHLYGQIIKEGDLIEFAENIHKVIDNNQ